MLPMSKIKIVLATGFLCGYPQGGGIWACVFQYVNGLRALGHEVFLIDLLHRTRRPMLDHRRIIIFQERMKRYGLGDSWAVLHRDEDKVVDSLDDFTVYGASENRLRKVVREADLLWSFAGSLNARLLRSFKRTALLDSDPGQLQVSALAWDMKLDRHDVLITVGTKINDPDCEIPKLGLAWRPFLPPIYLPGWEASPDPGPQAPITSVTQWNWAHEFRLGDRIFSDSKRDAYLRYISLPELCRYSFRLAANIDPQDQTGDVQLLESHGWGLVSPHRVARNPDSYADFIRSSRCEFGCAKPIYVDLKTGWFSDRSAAYLASGRPVIAENTGFSDHIETGTGLLTFSSLAEAAAAVEDVMARYSLHQRAARELAKAYFSSDSILPRMIEASLA
jgi:hypothetical protein